jgi:hypothetical protein
MWCCMTICCGYGTASLAGVDIGRVENGFAAPRAEWAREWLAAIYEPEIVALKDVWGSAMPSLRRSWNERSARRAVAGDAA